MTKPSLIRFVISVGSFIAVGIGLLTFFFGEYDNDDDSISHVNTDEERKARRKRLTDANKRIVIEICLSDITSAISAVDGLCTSIELCTNRGEGGVTPSIGLVEQLVTLLRSKDVELHVLIRPRSGNFVYSLVEFDVIMKEIVAVKEAGADGIVVGILRANGEVDEERMAVVRALSTGMILTFHRAFDVCPNPQEALESIIKLGCDRLLTSGQSNTAIGGISQLKELVSQASKKIKIIAASGITTENASEIILSTGVNGVHTGSSVHELLNDGVLGGLIGSLSPINENDTPVKTIIMRELNGLKGGYDCVSPFLVEQLVNEVLLRKEEKEQLVNEVEIRKQEKDEKGRLSPNITSTEIEVEGKVDETNDTINDIGRFYAYAALLSWLWCHQQHNNKIIVKLVTKNYHTTKEKVVVLLHSSEQCIKIMPDQLGKAMKPLTFSDELDKTVHEIDFSQKQLKNKIIDIEMQYSNIDALVNNPICCGYFLQFCNGQFSSENINFVSEVDRFRDMFTVDKDLWSSCWKDIDNMVENREKCTPSPLTEKCFPSWRSAANFDAVNERIKDILNEFVRDNAPHQVCISTEFISKTMKRIKLINLYGPKVFDEACLDPIKTMRRDLLPRFLRSDIFNIMISNLASCDPLPPACALIVPPPDKYVLRVNPVSYFTDDRAFTLVQLLQGEVLYTNFRRFLENNICSENAICVRMIDHFEELMSAGKTKEAEQQAWTVYQYFVAPGSTYEVSTHYLDRKDVMMGLAEPKKGMFKFVRQSAYFILKINFKLFETSVEYRGLGRIMRAAKIRLNEVEDTKEQRGWNCMVLPPEREEVY